MIKYSIDINKEKVKIIIKYKRQQRTKNFSIKQILNMDTYNLCFELLKDIKRYDYLSFSKLFDKLTYRINYLKQSLNKHNIKYRINYTFNLVEFEINYNNCIYIKVLKFKDIFKYSIAYKLLDFIPEDNYRYIHELGEMIECLKAIKEIPQ